MEPQIQYVKTSDGVNIAHYAIGSGPALIWMSAGSVTNIEDERGIPYIRPLIEASARVFTLVRYDLRGCGLSDRDVKDLSLPAMMRDLEAVADRTAPASFALLGNGISASAAVAYAAAHPERVSHLVFWGPLGTRMSNRSTSCYSWRAPTGDSRPSLT